MNQSDRTSKVPSGIEDAIVEALDNGTTALVASDEEGALWLNRAARRLLGISEDESEDHAARVATDLGLAIEEALLREGWGRPESVVSCRFEVPLANAPPLAITACWPDGAKSYVAALAAIRTQPVTEDALRRAEERFEQLVESLAANVWILKQRRVVYANRAAAELFGVDRSLLIGVDITELFHADDMRMLSENLDRAERGEPVPPHEYRAMARDGSVLVVELSCVSLEHDGEPTVLAFGHDVTERKREEQQLLQSDRLSALGMMASGMAHAINNPLTYVLLNLDHLAKKLPGLFSDQGSMPDVMARLAEAREGAERMATIVKRMRSFARTDETTNRVLDLRNVLESVVELVGHEVHHRGKLTTHFETVPPVLANESKVEQICLGLLLFAAQMLPDDAAMRHEVRLSLTADDRPYAVIEILCEGCEVVETDIERLFDPFNSVDEAKNLGLGLSVCSGLIEQLGGHIEARTIAGTGLLLRATIPCVPLHRLTEPTSSTRIPSSTPPQLRGKARILVVDDDPGVGRALRLMLEDEHEVKTMVRPREALQELLGDSGYDLIFCDLMMPELSGMDIYQVLRFNRPGYELRIVFMTGGAFTPSARRFLEQVSNQRIEKPFNLRSLQRLVERSARRHH